MSFETEFHQREHVREKILAQLQKMLHSEIDNITTWNDLIEAIQFEYSVSIINAAGINISGKKLYPLAEYGWDGGCPISTSTYNLNQLVGTDLFNGPYASIVEVVDSTIPGIAFHECEGEVVIQIFN